MRDIAAEEMTQRLLINGKILEVLRRYGFRLIEPSPIESLETLEAKCGSEIRDEIYWFKDKAGRDIGLRFDLTVGMSRIIASRSDWMMPIKLCSISNMWRYDEPQHGRYRCFYQWDAEIFGIPNVEADAEIISLSIDVLNNLGLEVFETRISNRKLVEGFLIAIGVKKGVQMENTLRAIDKYSKLSEKELTQEFIKCDLNRDQVQKIFSFISIRGKPIEALPTLLKIVGGRDAAEQGFKELSRLVEVLTAMGKVETCMLDMSVVRGIAYYDGIVFEIYDKAGEEIGAIVGGGRFNGLCGNFGRDVPATGVAGGIERIMLSMEKANLLQVPHQAPSVFIVAVDEEARKKALELVAQLRLHGVATDFDMKGRSLTRQLEYADRLRIPFAVIIGRRELEKGKVKLKNMERREETEIGIEQILEKILKS